MTKNVNPLAASGDFVCSPIAADSQDSARTNSSSTPAAASHCSGPAVGRNRARPGAGRARSRRGVAGGPVTVGLVVLLDPGAASLDRAIPISGPPVAPNSTAWLEDALHSLRATGLTGHEKMSVILLLSGFVRNTATLG